MSLITAKKIFENNIFVGHFNAFSTVNCDEISGSPKEAWLVRDPTGENEYTIVTVNPAKGSALKGVWIDQGGRGILLDAALSDFIAKCNSCCGEDSAVSPVYNGVFPANDGPVLKTYTILRSNNGSILADQDAAYAYLKDAVPNSFSRSSRNNGTGVTTYTMQAYADPFPKGADTITQTALTFLSNVPSALGGGMQYHFELIADGVRIATGKNAASVAALNTALAADTAFTARGAFSVVGGAIQLSSTNTDYASLVITQIAV